MEITVKHEFTMSPELETFFSRVMAPLLEKATADLPASLKQIARLNAIEDLQDLEKAIAPKKEETGTGKADYPRHHRRTAQSRSVSEGVSRKP